MHVGLIGAGNMARAMARGWGEPVLCSDSGSGRARTLADEVGGRAADSNLQVAEGSDVVVLCHKPAQLASIAAEIAQSTNAVVSVLGGVGVAALQDAYPGTPVVRTMPNTPVAVRRGVVLYTPGDTVEAAFEAQIVGLFERLGTVVKLEERHMAAAAAVTGVGPAYQALLAEAQVDAAVRHGLPPGLAGPLVTDTMSGTAALLAARDYDTLGVRREVTSPGGSTARGLAALERAGVRTAFQDAADSVIGWSTS
jgi:pyrroline-5-carboxylate reductase